MHRRGDDLGDAHVRGRCVRARGSTQRGTVQNIISPPPRPRTHALSPDLTLTNQQIIQKAMHSTPGVRHGNVHQYSMSISICILLCRAVWKDPDAPSGAGIRDGAPLGGGGGHGGWAVTDGGWGNCEPSILSRDGGIFLLLYKRPCSPLFDSVRPTPSVHNPLQPS